ncbi:MAG: bifunctional pyr operon transcriptional regulator/uracil phosphoribosyltransferase PyrR [Elusimicrobiota bacterium]
MSTKIIMDKDELNRKIKRLASEILDDAQGGEKLVLVGIRSMGVHLANRIKKEIKNTTGMDIPVGILDITLYRDDFSRKPVHPKIKQTILDFDITDKHVILIDDVIWTGRTVRAALDHLIDFGRPDKVRLCVLVDRGGRELPIEPNFVGKRMNVDKNHWIELNTKETKGKDELVLSGNKD